jgi:hypothetical protein
MAETENLCFYLVIRSDGILEWMKEKKKKEKERKKEKK